MSDENAESLWFKGKVERAFAGKSKQLGSLTKIKQELGEIDPGFTLPIQDISIYPDDVVATAGAYMKNAKFFARTYRYVYHEDPPKSYDVNDALKLALDVYEEIQQSTR